MLYQKDFQSLIDWLSSDRRSGFYPAVFVTLAAPTEKFPYRGEHRGYVVYAPPQMGIKKLIPGYLYGVLGQKDPRLSPVSSLLIKVEFTTPVSIRLAWFVDVDDQRVDVTNEISSTSDFAGIPPIRTFEARSELVNDLYYMNFSGIEHLDTVIPSPVLEIPK